MSADYTVVSEVSYPTKEGDSLGAGRVPQIDYKNVISDCGGVDTNGEFSLTVHDGNIIRITCKDGYVFRLKDNKDQIAYCLLCEEPGRDGKWYDIDGNLHEGADRDNEFSQADIYAISHGDNRFWQRVFRIEELNAKGELVNLYRCVRTKPLNLQPHLPKVVCENGLRFEIDEDKGTCMVSEDKSAPSESLVIPDKYGVFDVCFKGIGEAFSHSETLKKIVLPPSMDSIPACSFTGCSALSEVVWPDSVECIEDAAFSFCDSLADLVFPKSLKYIQARAFQECSSLRRVKLPDGLLKIGKSAFKNCKSLVEISIPESVTKIGSGAFEGCDSLKNIKLPKSIIKGLSEKEIQDYIIRITTFPKPMSPSNWTGTFDFD